MSEWQPIETAPKDGKRILTFRYLGDGYKVRVAYYTKGVWRNAQGHNPLNATHWMPLPEPPK